MLTRRGSVAAMMDYQFLTMERVGDSYRSLQGLSTITSLESMSWLDNGAPLHFMPQIFSPLEIPYAYHFKEEDNKKSEEELEHGSLFGTGANSSLCLQIFCQPLKNYLELC